MPRIQPKLTKKNAKEATFPGGYKAWSRYLLTELEKDNPANKSFQGGNVVVNFVVDKDGSIVDVFLSKSAEFILDQRALQIVTASKKWEPAIINGKTVRAYRRQPFTFLQE